MTSAEFVEVPASTTHLIHDLDGTILDSSGIYCNSFNAMADERGIPRATEALLRAYHHGRPDESIYHVLLALGVDTTANELNGFMIDFYRHDNVAIENPDDHLFPDAVNFIRLADAHGKNQTVVTNRPHGKDRGNGSPRNIITNSCLRSLIGRVVCGDDSEYHKPDRRVLDAHFGADLTSLGEMVVVGDQYVDAEFARNLGCAAILVAREGTIPHLDKLGKDTSHVTIVPSLDCITFAS